MREHQIKDYSYASVTQVHLPYKWRWLKKLLEKIYLQISNKKILLSSSVLCQIIFRNTFTHIPALLEFNRFNYLSLG